MKKLIVIILASIALLLLVIVLYVSKLPCWYVVYDIFDEKAVNQYKSYSSCNVRSDCHEISEYGGYCGPKLVNTTGYWIIKFKNLIGECFDCPKVQIECKYTWEKIDYDCIYNKCTYYKVEE